ncbi:protein kinase domain-containing protein [Dictyobacter kobayashii]|uniref:non-specific serine/threonine protein kinase n=1 Tax=Dictyobacter kobayashii TaxID=2014872 RepID=A0A402AUK3_9CHLR|nr:protein kinase [Dictyobacter kobayashii]GCE22777.1 hypothetical protein KDK_65770 [Dictyobacter kobayashii]
MLPEDCKGAARERFMTRFNQQAAALCRLQHPYIVPTYAFGEQYGYPYLVTPLIEGETVASFLKRQQRCAPDLMLALLRQIADALDYAHNNHVIHGTLKSSNVLLVRQGGPDGIYSVMVAGFGLAHMLEMRGIGQVAHQYPGLFSVAGTLLTNPVYIAPEVILGGPFDARSDVYALGILIFEMLCGHPPFSDPDPFVILRKHVDERIPSLQAVSPDVPAALDIALQRALERDPAFRLQSPGKLVTAFERVLDVMEEAARPAPKPPGTALPMNVHLALVDTLPPGENGENVVAMAGITSSRVPSVAPTFPGNTFKLQSIPNPKELALGPAPRGPVAEMVSPDMARRVYQATSPVGPREQSPLGSPPPLPGGATNPAATAVAKEQSKANVRPDMGRRRVVMAVNGVITAGVLLGGGFSLLRLFQNGTLQVPGQTEAHKPQSLPATSGAVIHTTVPAKNTAQIFKNPVTNREDILIHLPDGQLVAYDRACSHQQALVNYDPQTHKLICPLHHSQFDPQHAGAVLKGPATRPLKSVTIHVNTNGTITVK